MHGYFIRNLPGKTVRALALALLLLLTVGGSTVLAQAPIGSGYYVRQGDTVYNIAARHGITVEQLASINPGLPTHGYAQVGTTLNVPIPGLIGPTPSQCSQMHTVNPNETLAWIGGAYGVNPAALAQLNNLPSGAAVNTGNILCLPSYARLNYSWQGTGPAPAPVPVPAAPSYVPLPQPVPAAHVPAGPWSASYYHYQPPAALILTRSDQAINFNWGHGSPGGGVQADLFSVSWTNTFHFKRPELPVRWRCRTMACVCGWATPLSLTAGYPRRQRCTSRTTTPPAGTHFGSGRVLRLGRCRPDHGGLGSQLRDLHLRTCTVPNRHPDTHAITQPVPHASGGETTMNRHSKLPARFLLVLLGTILIVAGMTSVSLANTPTEFHGSYFDLVP